MPFGHWRADPAWRRIDLLSDVHLHAEAPATFEAWKQHLNQTPADAVLILGDLFDVWLGDDARHDGFESACADVLRSVSRVKPLAFMHGNRDFLLGVAMCHDAGLQSLPDPTLATAWGQAVLLTHGDALCIDDLAYQRFRKEARGEAWQAAFLSLALPERRRQAQAMREASKVYQSAMPASAWSDVDAKLAAVWLIEAGSNTLVHGHTHRPGQHALPDGRVRHVLGDWQFDDQPKRARILSWTASGMTSIDLAGV